MKGRKTERKKESERERVCVCVCYIVRMKERDREKRYISRLKAVQRGERGDGKKEREVEREIDGKRWRERW